MSWDMQNQEELNKWIKETLVYAAISSGKEVDEEDIDNMIRQEVVSKLPENMSMKELATRVFEVAETLLATDAEPNHELSDDSQRETVIVWILRSVAVIFIGKGKAFSHESLEYFAELYVTSRVQGNRRSAQRQDLDQLVRRCIEWGCEQTREAVAA